MGIHWTPVTRRAFLCVGMLAAIWAIAVFGTGGFTVTLGGMRVSSHAWRNPALFALAASGIGVWLARPTYRRALQSDLSAMSFAVPGSLATWLLVAGIGVRIWYWLLAPPMWLDEEMIALNIRDHTLTTLHGPLWLAQAAPLGWLISERVISQIAGFREVVLRMMPVAFSVATLVVAWWVGRRWMSAIGGAAFVFLLSIGQWVFHYSLELKHYSADTFFGLLLPVLVVWALEGRDARERVRRAAIWWAVAILGQWWSMGGLLVAPACVIVLLVATWREDGGRASFVVVALGSLWLAAFGLHYAATLRFAIADPFLQRTWSGEMAPASATLLERVIWISGRAAKLAEKPGGTELSVLLWLTVLCGFLVARPRLLGIVMAAVPVSAALLAMARVTPLYERFVLWSTPAAYFGVAFAVDMGVHWARARLHLATRVAGVALAAGALLVCIDIGRRGQYDIPIAHHGNSNHQLDDRSAVRWLAAQRRPGDVLLTTHLAQPAIWWYTRVPISEPALATSIDGVPIFEVGYDQQARNCDPNGWARPLATSSRALIYFGFRFDDVPKDFDGVFLSQLSKLGIVTDSRVFSERSSAVIVQFFSPRNNALFTLQRLGRIVAASLPG